jgi:glucan phosphoethanolaminetransferase (alkaline phosphatase superfamily)
MAHSLDSHDAAPRFAFALNGVNRMSFNLATPTSSNLPSRTSGVPSRPESYRAFLALAVLSVSAAPNVVYLFTTRPAHFWIGQTLTSLLLLATPLLLGASLRTALLLTLPLSAWTLFATGYAIVTGLPPSVLALQILREATAEELQNYLPQIAIAAAGGVGLMLFQWRLARACRSDALPRLGTSRWIALGLLAALLGKDIAKSGWNEGGTILLERITKMQPFAPVVLLLRMQFGDAVIPDRSGVLTRYAVRPKSPAAGREICVLVVGESARRNAFGLYTPSLPTTPRLQNRELLIFRNATSCGTATIQGVPILLTGKFPDQGEFLPFRHLGLVEAFRLGGFHTAWVSTQQADGDVCSFITAFSGNAAERKFVNGRLQRSQYRNPELKHDGILLDEFDRLAHDSGDGRLFVVLHVEGSHMPYPTRYPPEFEKWPVDEQARTTLWRWLPPYDAYQQVQLRNAYLNTVLYTDWFLDQLIERLTRLGGMSSLIFLSDHGENDPGAPLMPAGHAVATDDVLNIPLLIWLSPEFRAARGELVRALEANTGKAVSALDVFSTACGLHGLETSAAEPAHNLASPDYREQQRHILTLDGRIVPWPAVVSTSR